MNRKFLLYGALGLLTVLLMGAGFSAVLFSGDDDGLGATFTVRRGPLAIKVLEGGNVQSLESQELKSEVKGWQGTKILSIKEEGYYVTEEDVKNGLVLVELDTSELTEKLTTAEIAFKGTQASLTEAKQGYEIQLSKSDSEIYDAELKLKFARLELEKYLGTDLTMDILDKVADFLDELEYTIPDTLDPVPGQQPAPAAGSIAPDEDLVVDGPVDLAEKNGVVDEDKLLNLEEDTDTDSVELFSTAFRRRHPEIDFAQYAKPELLGEGEANQKIRELEDQRLLAEKERGLAKTQYDGSLRLYEQKFLTSSQLDNDKMDVDKKTISVQAAETAKTLFVRYEFPKQAEKLLSDYIQAERSLERTRKQAVSEMAKARAKWLSTEAQANIERERIKEYQDQIAKATMRAKIPGLVVYGGGNVRYWDQEPIKEGATVRERQTIITIPDTSKMSVELKIHESAINLVKKGQKANVRVEAFDDRLLTGEVVKVSVLPDSEDRWMNPDLKVYETTVQIEGNHEWLKPGMSAEVEIMVRTLPNVLYVPIQCVVPRKSEHYCYVVENGEVEERKVETGDLTVSYIEIKDGLEENEKVLLRPPASARQDQADETGAELETEQDSDKEVLLDDPGGDIDDDSTVDSKSEEPDEVTALS